MKSVNQKDHNPGYPGKNKFAKSLIIWFVIYDLCAFLAYFAVKRIFHDRYFEHI